MYVQDRLLWLPEVDAVQIMCQSQPTMYITCIGRPAAALSDRIAVAAAVLTGELRTGSSKWCDHTSTGVITLLGLHPVERAPLTNVWNTVL